MRMVVALAAVEAKLRQRKSIPFPLSPWTKYIPITPTERQSEFLQLTCEEALYGGAAGGGKSLAILAAALQYVDRPGYAAIIFRRTYSDLALPGALMERAREWLGPSDATWRDSEKTWHFPSGATLTFGYLDAPLDHFRYQSSAFQFLGWDELTQLREEDYRYLFSRLRRLTDSDIPLRVRAASNPGGVGHDWVKQRFLIEGETAGRIFVPAKLSDNLYLDQESYIRAMSNLDPITRQQLLNGDWTARHGGNMFKREWFPVVDILPDNLRQVRFWDLAATEAKQGTDPDWTVGLLLAKNEAHLYVADVRRIRATPGRVEALVKQTAEIDGNTVAVRMEEEPGSSGVAQTAAYRRLLTGWDFRGIRSTGDKHTRAAPVAAQAEGGNIKLVRGSWLTTFLDEIEQFPSGSHDDQVDALSGAFSDLVSKGRMRVWV